MKSPNRGVALASALAFAMTLLGAQASRAAEPEKLDCHGGSITITGEHRTVELANCAEVRVEGSHNVVRGQLTQHSKVYVTGNGNTVRLHPVEGISFSRMKDTGHDNDIGGPG